MLRRLILLILVPVLILSAQTLNEGKILWTKNFTTFEAAVPFYYQTGARARDVDGRAIIWSVEQQVPVSKIVAERYNHSIYAIDDSSRIYRKDNFSASSPWTYLTEKGGIVALNTHYNPFTGNSYVIAARSTSAMVGLTGFLYSIDGGVTWQSDDVDGNNCSDAVISPINQTDSLGYNFFVATPSGIQTAPVETTLPRDWSGLSFYQETFDDTLLPAGWDTFGVQDSLREVTTGMNLGDMRLWVKTSDEPGPNFGASYDLSNYKEHNRIKVSFELRPSVPDNFGKIVLKSRGFGLEMAYYDNELSVNLGGLTWYVIEDPGIIPVYNDFEMMIDLSDTTGTLITPDVVVGGITLAPQDDDESEFVVNGKAFQTTVHDYYIDNLELNVELYDLASHPNNEDEVLASGPRGIYHWDGSDWNVLVNEVGKWNTLKGDGTGDNLVALEVDTTLEFDTAYYYSYTSRILSVEDILGSPSTSVIDVPQDLNVKDIDLNPSGDIFIATADYPYRYDGSQWEKLDSGYELGISQYSSNALSITSFSNDTLYLGTDNATFMSSNGGDTWIKDAEGIDTIYQAIPDSLIDIVDALLEDSIPGGNLGIFDLLEDEVGPIPDVDSSDNVNILMMNIKDKKASGLENWMVCYWDVNNQDVSDMAEMSNKGEILYVDYPNFLDGYGDMEVDSLIKSTDKMVLWEYDAEETRWLTNGFVRYAMYLLGLGENAVDTTSYVFSPDTAINSTDTSAVKNDHSYLFIQYLKQRFGNSFVDSLYASKLVEVVDSATGETDTTVLQGVESVTEEITSQDSEFGEIFSDWSLASYLNDTSMNSNYGYENLPNVGFMDYYLTEGFTGAEIPYLSSIALKYYPDTLDPISEIRFNAVREQDVEVPYNLHTIVWDGTSTDVTFIEPDDFTNTENEYHSIPINTDMDSISILIEAVREGNLAFNLLLDQSPDDFGNFGILQAPMLERIARVYYYTHLHRYTDVGSEGLTLTYPISDTATTTTGMNYMAELPDGKLQYATDIVLPDEDGTMNIVVESEDKASNMYSDSLQVSVETMGISGGVIAFNNFEVNIPENALTSSHLITAVDLDGSYYVGPGIELNKEAEVKIRITEEIDDEISLYRKDNGNWVELGGIRQDDVIKVKTEKLGEFKLMPGDMVVDAPAVLKLSVPRGIGRNDVRINYGVPEKSRVSLSIYNALGQKVKTMINDVVEPGYYTVRWNGRNNRDVKVSSGVYFGVLESGSEKLSEKLILLQ